VVQDKSEDMLPVFWALGTALFQAQHLESGLGLLIALLNRKRVLSSPANATPLDDASSKKTLGEMFNDVRKRKYFTPAQKTTVHDAIDARNALIHAYWSAEKIQAMVTPAGRDWVFEDLRRIEALCNKAGQLVDGLIDQYLKQFDLSLGDISNPMWQQWQSGVEPPSELLQE
jgi:hypothetical protein